MCPNANDEQIRNEFNEVVTALGGRPLTIEEFKSKELRASRTGIDAAAMDAAYEFWDLNNGNPVDKAPNGKESILFKTLYEHYEDRQSAIKAKTNTYSKKFKTWFGDWLSEDKTNVSKAVDENGEPKVLWHGTEYVFDTFEIDYEHKRGRHLVHSANGFFFTDTKQKAFKYRHKITMPVFLNMRNPGYTSVTDKGVVDNVDNENKIINDSSFDSAIIVRYDKEGDDNGLTPTTLWVVKDPNQIKSIDNNGNFSTVDNNIYHQEKKKINRRRKNFTPEEHVLSQRISTILRTLFPEISVEFVDSIEGGYVGEADLEAMRILLDIAESGIDTEPHEFAHFYVGMFIDTPLVQKGVAAFGSEEALVLAIGVRTVEMEAKARTWWQKFIDFIKKLLNKNKLYKQYLLAEITDAFLTRKQLTREGATKLSGVRYQENKLPTIDEVRNIILSNQALIEYDPLPHVYTVKATGEKLTPVTTLKQTLGYDTYDKSQEDELQQQITREASDTGGEIHAVLESMIKGTFKVENFPLFTKSALNGIAKIYNLLKKDFDFVMSEAMLCDVEHKVAGTADLILRNKKTGEYELYDFKTKMITYNGNKKNKKGKNLWGFQYVDSTRFGLNTTRVGYDFQLTAYQQMLKKLGIDVNRRAIVPICYDVKDGKVVNVYTSKIFGKDSSENQLKNGGYTIAPSKSVEFDVRTKVFGETNVFDVSSTHVEKAMAEIKDAMQKIIKRLEIQKQIFKLRGRRTKNQLYEATKTLERIEGLEHIAALFEYAQYAANQLSYLAKQIEKRYKEGDKAQWDLEVLVAYRSVADSYKDVGKISGIAHRYSDIFGEDVVKQIDFLCNRLQSHQRLIQEACDTIGMDLHIKAIQPYIKNVQIEWAENERSKYMEGNPRKSGESRNDFLNRVDEHVELYLNEHTEEIEAETQQWLKKQSSIANLGFECNGLLAELQSVYESKDPIVQGTVILFDKQINEQERKMFRFRYALNKAVKAFRKKYGTGNFSELKEVFADFVEIVGDVAYIVNERSGLYLEAEKAVRKNLRADATKTYKEQSEAYDAWLDEHCPISDVAAYDAEVLAHMEIVYSLSDKKSEKAIKDNLKLPKTERKSWYALMKEELITPEIKDVLDAIESEIEPKYRKPNPKIYKNEKYQKLMELKESNDPKYQLYKVLMDAIEEVDHKLPGKLRLHYRLPGVIKRGAERVGADGLMSAISNAVQQSTVIMEDSDERGTFVDEEGKRINQIPLFFKYNPKITLEEQSFDLPTIFYKWYDSATMYLAKKAVEGHILQTQTILQTRETKDRTVSLLGKDKSETTSSHKKGTQSLFEAWVDLVFYGNRIQDSGSIKIPFTNKKADINKLVRSIVKYSSFRTMSVNYVSALNNILVAEANQAEEAFAGEFIDKGTYTKATQIFLANVPEMITDANRVAPQNKVNKLLEMFGIYEPGQNMLLTGLMRHSVSDYAHILTKIGDKAAQARFMIAALLYTPAKDKDGKVVGNMWEMIDVNEDGELVVDDKVENFYVKQQDEFQLKLRVALMGLHGNYNQKRAAVAAETKWYGAVGLSLRRWIEPNLERRYAAEHVSNFTGTKKKGFYREGFSYMFLKNPMSAAIVNFFLRYKKDGEKYKIQAAKWGELDKTTRLNLWRWGIEFGTAFLAFLMYALLGNGDGDDDDEHLTFLRYQMYRLYTDLTFFVLPTSFSKILNDPFPPMSVVNDVLYTIGQLFDPFEEYESGKHLFDNKLLDRTVKLIPGAKQIGRYANISSEMELFMRQR